MGIIRKDFKYKIIKNFLSKEETALTNSYLKLRHLNNENHFEILQNKQLDTCFYGDPLIESLLVIKLKKVEEVSGLKLLPTYGYSRFYTKFSSLKKHTDRESCEISVTVFTGSDGTPWPFVVDNKSFLQEPGDAIIYLGCEVEHERKEFLGDWHSQFFIHYVDAEGPNKEFIFDKRGRLGVPREH
tara:strand:- start:147 stop:701 length:555 start_codon:yes stop_codon:yes gene_type:complete